MAEVRLDVRDFANHYRQTFAQTLEVCNAVPEGHWDWRPRAGMRSFRELVGHIVGNELAMSRGILSGDWDLKRFELDFPSREEAMSFFRKIHEEAVTGFVRVDEQLFQQKVETPFGRSMTRSELALEMLEREIHHRGILYTYLALLDLSRPPLY